jgi:heme-degrading monooxygenase HmoA
MLAVIYRWRLKTGMEQQFVDGWTRVTKAIRHSCGSYGSRLHRVSDGTWLAYARWPDDATRRACQHSDEEGRQLMRGAVEEAFEEVVMSVAVDLLREPLAPSQPINS